MALTCPRCQSDNTAASRFCAQCGAALGAAVTVEAPTPAPVPAAAPAPEAAPVAASAPAAVKVSRRQMTVLFCDLVGSTELANHVDPEDLMEALQAYHAAMRRIATRFGGFVARIVGDGVDLYFGFPMASEDDGVRALHAGLAILDEVQQQRVGSVADGSAPRLGVRVGVATGMVAVGGSEGIALAGSTPNLAARIQAAVPPGTLGIAPGTRRIAGAQFECEDLGPHVLKGFDEPVHIHAVKRALSLDSRSAWRGRDSSTPMVGRRAELAALLSQWQRVKAGLTCATLITAEPGLGKSRLVTAFDQALPHDGHTLLRLQCSPFHTNSALQPFVQHLGQAAGFAVEDTPLQRLDKLEAQLAIAGLQEPLDICLLAALLGVPTTERYPPLAMPPPMQLQLTKETLKRYFAGLTGPRMGSPGQHSLARYFVGLAEQRPLVVVFEDMHWIDPTSLELVELVMTNGGEAPILVLMTARPEFRPPWPATAAPQQVVLTRLDDAQALAVADQLTGGTRLASEVLRAVVAKADGVPLFIEEMARMLLDSGAADVAAHEVPDTLVDLLMERLDRLGDGKALAQVAAVIGREFDRPLLSVAAELDTGPFEAALDAMLASGLILPAGAGDGRFLFKHALVEDTAYASVPKRLCTVLHGRVADALLGRFPERVQQQPELAARHLTRAGRGLQAAEHWLAAGGQALGRGAPREAAGHLRQGLEALKGVPDSPVRAAAELGLLSMLGPTTMVLRGPGSAEFGAVQERAYALCQALPGRPRLFPITYGLCLFHWGGARLALAQQLSTSLLDAAQGRPGDVEAAMAAHNMAGMVAFHRGDALAARAHLAHSVALYEPQRDAALYPVYLMDFGVFGRFYLSLATLVAGDADRARDIAAEAFALAGTLNQPHTLGFSMLANFITAVMRDDVATAAEFAERCIGFSSQFGFPEFIAMARIARGWARARGQGDWAGALADLQEGIAGWRATGFENWQSWFAVLEAQCLAQLGRHAEALAAVEHQFERIAANGERQFESLLLAEKAVLLDARPGAAAAAAECFDRAHALAESQGAAAWRQRTAERRAARSL